MTRLIKTKSRFWELLRKWNRIFFFSQNTLFQKCTFSCVQHKWPIAVRLGHRFSSGEEVRVHRSESWRKREQFSLLQDQKQGMTIHSHHFKVFMSWSLFTLQQHYRIPLNSLPHGPAWNNPFDCLLPFFSWQHLPQTLTSAPVWTSCPVDMLSSYLLEPVSGLTLWVFILSCVISYFLDLNVLPFLDLLLCFHRAYSAAPENVNGREVKNLRLHFLKCHLTVILKV